MENKIREIVGKIKKSDKKIRALVLLGIIGIALIFLSESSFFSSEKKETENYSYDSYVSSLEKETEALIEAIDGAGECKVMLTLKNTKESVFAKNGEENSSEGSKSNSYEYVLHKEASGEEPLLLKEYFPRINGIAVVCSGGDSITVKEEIINCLSSVFDIPSSKISVTKLRQ